MLVNGRNFASTIGAGYTRYRPYMALQIQRYKMQQATQQAMDNLALYSSNMFGASLSLSQGLASLTAKAALQRVQDAVAARQSQISSTVNGAGSLDISA